MGEKTMMEVSAKEQALLIALRHKFRYGEVVVIMRDGVPMRLSRAVEFDDLTPAVDAPKKRGVR